MHECNELGIVQALGSSRVWKKQGSALSAEVLGTGRNLAAVNSEILWES